MTFSLTVLSLAKAGAAIGPIAAAGAFAVLRRLRLRRTAWMGLSLFAAAYSLCVWTFLIEPRSLAVRELEVGATQWTGPPLRIGVISDTHVGGPHMSPERMRRIVARMNRERPDIVVLLGDYAPGHVPAERRSEADRATVLKGVSAFAGLDAPLGVVGVIGNHDAWYDERQIAGALREAGVTVVDNGAVEIKRSGASFWIAGLADQLSRLHEPSIGLTMREVPPDAPVLLLTHFPDPWAEAPERIALTLAGHTHCGQVVLPVVGRLAHASAGSKRWPCGLYRDGERQLYVSGGVGVSMLPVRFGAPPEIALITLRSQPLLAPASPSQ